MKIEWNKKYTTIAMYSCIVIVFGIAVFFICQNLEYFQTKLAKFVKLLSPIIYGFIIAYLCNPIMKFCENKLFKFIERKKSRKKMKRTLSLITTYIIVSIFLTIFVLLIVPQVVASYTDLQSKMSSYVSSAQKWVENLINSSEFFTSQYNKLLEFIDLDKITDSLKDLISNSYAIIQNISPYVVSYIGGIVTELKNSLLGIIFSVYFLLSKEKLVAQIKKILNAFFSQRVVKKTIEITKFTDKTFGGFIIGKLLDSLIIGILCFIVMAIFDMPYYQLISVIIGVTNIIPFFGPFIGAIPSVFFIFIANPTDAFWFIIIILIIQQLDGNVIGPKILGDSTGLSALWVVVAIVIMGGLFGIMGMFIGVPTFAVIYVLFKEVVEKKLSKKNLPVETKDYYNL